MDIDVGGHECTLYERQILICYDLPVYRRTKKRIYFIVCTQICFTHCSRSSGPMYIYGIYNDDRYASTSKASAGLLGVTCQWKGQCGAPSILGYLRGCPCLALPWADGPRADSQHLALSFYLSNSSDSTKPHNGMCPAKATDTNQYSQLITIQVDLTILLAQQETKHDQPRRPPPGTALHTLRTRQQQQNSTWLGASQSVRGSRRHDFHATPSYIYARPLGSYISRHSGSQLEPKAPRRWSEQTWLFV
jgi:hypothetical protein